MAWRLFLRSIAQQYRHSSLGILWAFAPSALTAMVLVGSQRADALGPSNGVPGAFYGVFGVAMIQTFLEALGATRRIFPDNRQYLRRDDTLFDGLVLAAIAGTAFNVAVRMIVLTAVFLLFSIAASGAGLVAMIVGFAGIAALGAGIGLLVAPANALKRDLDHAFALLPWTLFAVTPVFVPANPDTLFGRICAANPLAWMFDGIRAAAYGGAGTPSVALTGALAGIATLVLGWFVARLARPHVLERIIG